jgi:hypothetical protein
MRLKKRFVALAALVGAIAAVSAVAGAGSPHFVGSPTFSISGNTATVNAKEAGLGGESIDVTLSGEAQCINNGGKHPKAVNKTGFSSTETVPVHNGQATYSIDATATFKPDCTPPMTVQFTSLVLTDTTNNLSVTLIP